MGSSVVNYIPKFEDLAVAWPKQWVGQPSRLGWVFHEQTMLTQLSTVQPMGGSKKKNTSRRNIFNIMRFILRTFTFNNFAFHQVNIIKWS